MPWFSESSPMRWGICLCGMRSFLLLTLYDFSSEMPVFQVVTFKLNYQRALKSSRDPSRTPEVLKAPGGEPWACDSPISPPKKSGPEMLSQVQVQYLGAWVNYSTGHLSLVDYKVWCRRVTQDIILGRLNQSWLDHPTNQQSKGLRHQDMETA